MRIPIALTLTGILCLNTACATKALYQTDWGKRVEVWEEVWKHVKVERAVVTDTRLILHLAVKIPSSTGQEIQNRWATLEISDVLQGKETRYTPYTSDPLAWRSDKGEDVLVTPLSPVPLSRQSLCVHHGAWEGSCLVQIGPALKGALLLRQEDSPFKVLHRVDLPLPDEGKYRTRQRRASVVLLTPVAVATDLAIVGAVVAGGAALGVMSLMPH